MLCLGWGAEERRLQTCKQWDFCPYDSYLFLSIWLFLSFQLSPYPSLCIPVEQCLTTSSLLFPFIKISIHLRWSEIAAQGSLAEDGPSWERLRLGITLSRSTFIRIRIQSPFPKPGFPLWVGKGPKRKANTRQPSPSLMYWDRVLVLWVHN